MYRALPARTTSVSASSVSSSGTVAVVAVALVEVDVVGAQPRERAVDLLEDLRAREPAVAVGHLAEHLRREHVRVARPRLEHLAEELLRPAARVDVRGVDEVDAGVERRGDARLGLVAFDGAAVGQPGAEADLRDVELAVAESPVLH